MSTGSTADYKTLVSSCQEFYTGIRWISTSEFMKLRNERQWHIVDVRTDAERAVSIIPGALSLETYRALHEDFDGQPVLVYCTVGCRSAGQAQILQEQGVEVYNLWGGVIDWAFHNGEFTTLSGAPTREVHTHGKRWNLLPPTHMAVW